MSKMHNITRRHFLWTAGLSIPIAALAIDAGKPDAAGDAVEIAKDAYIWGSPLVLTEGYLQLAVDSNIPLNRFTLSTRLSTPADKVAGPNVDTLYGFAWLDLTPAPQILHVPDTNGRYKITNFIKDPLLRASINRLGPGAHVAQEALYFHAAVASDGRPLRGAEKYLLSFPTGQLPPADAFWSLILYGPDFYLVENAINRYSIGDRTEGLKTNADGSLDIHIQHEPPELGISNWLPAPAGGFQLILRTYQPRPALFNGEYKVAPIQPA